MVQVFPYFISEYKSIPILPCATRLHAKLGLRFVLFTQKIDDIFGRHQYARLIVLQRAEKVFPFQVKELAIDPNCAGFKVDAVPCHTQQFGFAKARE